MTVFAVRYAFLHKIILDEDKQAEGVFLRKKRGEIKARCKLLKMTFLVWLVRAFLYSVAAWIGLGLILPALGGGFFAMIISSITAAMAIGLDLFFSAKIRQRNLEQEAVARIIFADKILGGRKEGPEEISGQIEAPHRPEIDSGDQTSSSSNNKSLPPTP